MNFFNKILNSKNTDMKKMQNNAQKHVQKTTARKQLKIMDNEHTFRQTELEKLDKNKNCIKKNTHFLTHKLCEKDELVLAIVQGELVNPKGYYTMICTNKRVIIQNNTSMLSGRYTILLNDITNMRVNTKGLVKSEVTIESGSAKYVFKGFTPDAYINFVEVTTTAKNKLKVKETAKCITSLQVQNENSVTAKSTMTSKIEDLKALKELLDLNVLTEQEFEEQKNIILKSN